MKTVCSKFTPAVLVLGSQRRESLAVIRSLGRAGWHVIVARPGPAGQGESSRFCREIWPLPSLVGTTSHAAWTSLRARLNARPDVQWLFPVGDEEIAFCHEYQRDFPATVRAVAVDSDLASACQSKQRLFSIAAAAGVAVERFREISGGRDLDRALDEIGLPCVLKPRRAMDSLAGRKAVALRSPADRAACVAEFAALDIPLLVQRYAPGQRHNVYFLAEHGQLLAARQVRIVRTDRLDGTGLAVDGVSVPMSAELHRDCERLLRALNYHGAGCAQFLVDETTGERMFLEINSRIGANSAIACACGFDVPRLFLELMASGSSRLTLPNKSYPRRRYAWAMGDLHGLAVAWREKTIGWTQAAGWLLRLINTSLRADLHISWQWSDPRPTWFLLRSKIASNLQRLARTTGPASNAGGAVAPGCTSTGSHAESSLPSLRGHFPTT